MSAAVSVNVSDAAMRAAGWVPAAELHERTREADQLLERLQEAQWTAEATQTLYDAIEKWHHWQAAAEHPGAFKFCPGEVCRLVVDADIS